eukprot:TRINITY_DN11023_c0_g1_i1.p1 TRINITY_DN11023_c0_g1~~TRINITY_DN11023_c0_g1_i1.p1  ORF type:complete len:490 (-),score=138.54 TRINITY_DN11023_c0_g1_i1:19-1287(-)
MTSQCSTGFKIPLRPIAEDTWLGVIIGTKFTVLIHPSDAKRLSEAQKEELLLCSMPESLKMLPFLQEMRVVSHTLKKGQKLFIPQGWYLYEMSIDEKPKAVCASLMASKSLPSIPDPISSPKPPSSNQRRRFKFDDIDPQIPTKLSLLYDDLLSKIFSTLYPSDVVRFAMTCKMMYGTLSRNAIWEPFFQREYILDSNTTSDIAPTFKNLDREDPEFWFLAYCDVKCQLSSVKESKQLINVLQYMMKHQLIPKVPKEHGRTLLKWILRGDICADPSQLFDEDAFGNFLHTNFLAAMSDVKDSNGNPKLQTIQALLVPHLFEQKAYKRKWNDLHLQGILYVDKILSRCTLKRKRFNLKIENENGKREISLWNFQLEKGEDELNLTLKVDADTFKLKFGSVAEKYKWESCLQWTMVSNVDMSSF